MVKFLLVYLAITNMISYFLMYYDKACAKSKQWRVPEKILFQVVLAGGGIGGTLGMFRFRHKTNHIHFRYGFPAIAIMQIALILVACIHCLKS